MIVAVVPGVQWGKGLEVDLGGIGGCRGGSGWALGGCRGGSGLALVALGCCRGGSGCVLEGSVWALVADVVWALGGPWMASVWALGGCRGVLGGPLWLWAVAVGALGGPWRVPCGPWWPWAVAVGALGGPWRAAVWALVALGCCRVGSGWALEGCRGGSGCPPGAPPGRRCGPGAAPAAAGGRRRAAEGRL